MDRAEMRRAWHSLDGTVDGVLRERPQAGGAWEETTLPGCRDGKSVQSKGDQTVASECGAIRAYLDDLPTETDAMYRYPYDNSHGGNGRHVQAFITVADLLRRTTYGRKRWQRC